MKLLFDENLSPRLVVLLADLFPDSLHVRDVALQSAEDSLVWNYARDHGLLIVSKDADMHQRCFVFGAPPKVVWVRLGNCSTTEVANLLRRYIKTLEVFEADVVASFLSLS
jgi:predicted nuclease of predicted toxin-antitoxin system